VDGMRAALYALVFCLAAIDASLIVACTFHAPFSHLTVIRTPVSDVKSGSAHD